MPDEAFKELARETAEVLLSEIKGRAVGAFPPQLEQLANAYANVLDAAG
jgi:hypothetical protein